MAKYIKHIGDVSIEIEGTVEEIIEILKYENKDEEVSSIIGLRVKADNLHQVVKDYKETVIPSTAKRDKNLCDTCSNRDEIPVCIPDDATFSNGFKADSIIDCIKYKSLFSDKPGIPRSSLLNPNI